MNNVAILAQSNPPGIKPGAIIGYEPVLITVVVGMIAITSSIVKLTTFIKDLDKDIKLSSMDAMGQRQIILEKIVSSKNENSLKFDGIESRLNDMNSRLRRLENLPRLSEEKS